MDLVGKMLAGRYEILEEIGKGGMAHVYKARCHFLNRFVAIKVLKEELKDDKEFVTRFNTEAQAAARISDPHVVSIFDVGFENGLYYIVMEYVEGITLKEYIAEHKVLPWRTAADFAAQICEGLAAAHNMSVIHRDIKPQNIIMTQGDVLKITDFGIARASTQSTTTTAANSTIATVHYLSPEQARGGYTNERTDIYSLGVVLYEMLTGRLPFDDNTAVAIAIKHIQEKPILPRILNNDIPKSMEYIVMKAMNKEQAMRYASAEEFLSDLRKVIKNPDVELGDAYTVSDDDIGVTRKRTPIDDEAISRYGSKKPKNNPAYDEYAKRLDREMEESNLKRIDRAKAVRAQKKKERRVTIAAIIAAVVVIAGMWVGFSMISGGGLFTVFESGEKVEVPNLIDMNIKDAQKMYKPEGYSIIQSGEKASDKAVGTILEQTPPAGERATKGKDIIIRVVVSKGASNKTLPSYTGSKVEDARKKVIEDGFKVTVVEKESSREDKDKVLSQEPAAGSSVTDGALVTLYVGTGSEKKEDSDKDDDKTESSDTKKPSTSNQNTQSGSNSSSNSQNDNTTSSNNNNSSGNGTQNEGTTGGNTGSGGSNTGGSAGTSSGSGHTGSTGGQTSTPATPSQPSGGSGDDSSQPIVPVD